MYKRIAILALVLCVATAFVGCGGKKVTKTEGVTGKITLDGAPLPHATVIFVALDKSSGAMDGYAETNENGEYKLQTLTGAANAGTTPGKYGVKFNAQTGVDTGKTELVDGKEMPIIEPKSILPKRYDDEKTSGFEVEVVAGGGTFDFDLQSK